MNTQSSKISGMSQNSLQAKTPEQRARRVALTKIVMETQDLVNHYIVLSVLHNRELKQFSPAELLANRDILSCLTQSEVSRVTYLAEVERFDLTHAQTVVNATDGDDSEKEFIVDSTPITKIMVEDQNLVTEQLKFTVLFNRDLVKLSPMDLLHRADILQRLSKPEVSRATYLAGVEFEVLKAKAEALMAECIS